MSLERRFKLQILAWEKPNYSLHAHRHNEQEATSFLPLLYQSKSGLEKWVNF